MAQHTPTRRSSRTITTAAAAPQRHREAPSASGTNAPAASPRQTLQRQKIADLQTPGGMPERLRSGIEALSGIDLSDVQVHGNSSRPSQLHAKAYAKGNEIHLASGQERHLPHEAWHVVQQRQGRVRPNANVAGQPVNSDPGLEQEATRMGQQALQAADLRATAQRAQSGRASPGASPATFQLLSESEEGQLQDYALQQMDKAGYVFVGKATEAVNSICGASQTSGKKALIQAKSEFDKWLATQMAAKAASTGAAPKSEPKVALSSSSVAPPLELPPAALPTEVPEAQAEKVPAKHAKKAKKYVPLDLGSIKAPPLTASKSYLAVGKASAMLPSSASSSKTEADRARAVLSKFHAWKPSGGHGGCKDLSLRLADLQTIVYEAEADGRYFVKAGTGTGEYSAKNQLKIIHRSVDTPSGKKATFHITVSQDQLDLLGLEASDDT